MCSAYGWKHSYIEHNFKIHDDFLPYADWVDILEIIAEEQREKAERELDLNLLLGYQIYQLSPYREKPYLNFQKYQRMYGVTDSVKTPKQKLSGKEAEIKRAHDSLKEMGFGEFIK